MKKYLKTLLIFSSIVLLFSACAKKEVVKPSEESIKAQLALAVFNRMEQAYKARDLQGTLKDVSRDLKKGYGEFSTNLRKDMELYPKVELEINVDRVEESDNLIRIVFYWSGIWTDKEGGAHQGRGNGTYIYQNTGSSIILIDYIGDSPFGVAR